MSPGVRIFPGVDGGLYAYGALAPAAPPGGGGGGSGGGSGAEGADGGGPGAEGEAEGASGPPGTKLEVGARDCGPGGGGRRAEGWLHPFPLKSWNGNEEGTRGHAPYFLTDTDTLHTRTRCTHAPCILQHPEVTSWRAPGVSNAAPTSTSFAFS